MPKTTDADAPIVLAPSEQLHPDVRLTLDVLLAARREEKPRTRDLSPCSLVANLKEGPLDELLVSVEEAARRLGVGRSAMYELLASGQIGRVKVGRRTLVPVQELRSWVDRNVLAVGLAVTTTR